MAFIDARGIIPPAGGGWWTHADVAQWKRTGLLIRVLWVQIPSSAHEKDQKEGEDCGII